jgi:hypothetical protein
MKQNYLGDDVLALAFAGAHLIEIERKPVAEVNAILNNRRARQILIDHLNADRLWRTEGAPWLRGLCGAFNKISHSGRTRTLRRLLPECAEREVMDPIRDEDLEIIRLVKTKNDPLTGLNFQDEFFLLCQALCRAIEEKRDVRDVVMAMHN